MRVGCGDRKTNKRLIVRQTDDGQPSGGRSLLLLHHQSVSYLLSSPLVSTSSNSDGCCAQGACTAHDARCACNRMHFAIYLLAADAGDTKVGVDCTHLLVQYVVDDHGICREAASSNIPDKCFTADRR